MNTIRHRDRAKSIVVWSLFPALMLFVGVCFGQDCGEKENPREVIRCLSRYVEIVTSGGVAVYALADEEFTDLCEDTDIYNKIMLLEGTGHSVPNITRVVREKARCNRFSSCTGSSRPPMSIRSSNSGRSTSLRGRTGRYTTMSWSWSWRPESSCWTTQMRSGSPFRPRMI